MLAFTSQYGTSTINPRKLPALGQCERLFSLRAQPYIRLLSEGIARAPSYLPNRVLAAIYPRGANFDNSQQTADAVNEYLLTGRIMPVQASGVGRYQLTVTRGARWLPSRSATMLRDIAWGLNDCDHMVVEGSPHRITGKYMPGEGGVRPIHHFVVLKFRGGVYVADAYHGLVFDSVAAYAEHITIPGRAGCPAWRMKAFRVAAGGRIARHHNGGIAASDDWEAPVAF